MFDVSGLFVLKPVFSCFPATLTVDGTMDTNARKESLRKIETDRFTVILVSLMAGGTGTYGLVALFALHELTPGLGLNLTGCNNVILMDLWWNPAVEVGFLLDTQKQGIG